MFRETDRDDCISYHDWCAEIEIALAKGYEPEHVKMAMFELMEGMAKDHAANIDQYGVLTTFRDSGRVGKNVWHVYDLPIPECSPLWTATESN